MFNWFLYIYIYIYNDYDFMESILWKRLQVSIEKDYTKLGYIHKVVY